MLNLSRHEKGLSPNPAKSGIQDGSQGKTTPNAVNTLPTPVKTHTPLPWAYRPNEYDDWGIVRAAPDQEGRSFVICQARNPAVSIDELGAYRANGTDPYEANAALIVRAVNNHDDLVQLAHQYASDLCHPPSADSVERRLERIAAVLAKVGS